MPPHFARDLIAGFALDAADWRPQSVDDLYRYCYHVAGAVGCMMALVMGVSPNDEAVLDRACDLGMAFQLDSNIARDVAEDDQAGRCYLPASWLVEMDIPPGTSYEAAAHRQRLAVLAARLVGQRSGSVPRRARGSAPPRCRSARPGRCSRRPISMARSRGPSRRAASMAGTIAS